MKKVKNIVERGLYQGWSKQNIIDQIIMEIASDDELELIIPCGGIPELEGKATELYEKYRKEYYAGM